MTTHRLDLGIRPLLPGEARPVLEVFEGLSPRSRYHRFHAPTPRLSRRSLERLTAVDGIGHVAFVAETAPLQPQRRAVGIARLIRTGEATADMSIAVVDVWQGQGIGRMLLTSLGVRAAECGYRALTGVALAENRRVIRLVREVFPATTAAYSGPVVELISPVPAPIEAARSA